MGNEFENGKLKEVAIRTKQMNDDGNRRRVGGFQIRILPIRRALWNNAECGVFVVHQKFLFKPVRRKYPAGWPLP